MMARSVKIQLIAFILLSVTAFSLIAFVYVRIPSLLGMGRIEVTARFGKSGGLYPNANVTYRGVTVGKVTDVRLAPTGVDAVMSIDEDHLPPKSSRAEVHSVSAIGEQFVDLLPGSGNSDPLGDGDRIAEKYTSTPEPIAGVLDNTKNLLDSVNPGQLQTVLDEGSQAFRNLGPSLGQLVDNTNKLVDTANANYGSTEKLINDGGPVLDAQLASSPAIHDWARQLNGFSSQLKSSDGDLRALLRNGGSAAGRAQDLLSQLSPTAPTLLSNADVLAKLSKDYHAPIEEVLVALPMYESILQTVSAHGDLNLNLTTQVNAPNCSTGWVPPGAPGGPRNSNDISDEPLPSGNHCKLPQNNPIQPRSQRQLPCFEPGSPPGRRAATIYECRGKGYRPEGEGSRVVPGVGEIPGTGLELPDPPPLPNPLSTIGAPDSSPSPRSEDLTWQNLLLGKTGVQAN